MSTEILNYELTQWKSSDRPTMADFNADNEKISKALKSFANKNETVDATLASLSKK